MRWLCARSASVLRRGMNVEPRSRRSGSGRLPGEQTRARALHRIQSQSSPDPPKLESVAERRRRKEALQVRGGKPTSPREYTRIGKMPPRKPALEGAARVNVDQDGAHAAAPSSFGRACPKSPRSPQGPETRPTRPARSGDESSDLRKRALVLLASSKSAAVKEKTETFMQKHRIAFVQPGPPDHDTTRLREDELVQTATETPQAAESAETAQWCLPLDALTFVWLQSVFQWGIRCIIGCMLLSLRCCLGSMNCLKPLLVEEAPRRRYQDKPAVRTLE